MIETYISAAAALAILFKGFVGSRDGLFNSMARMLFSAVALLAACRYWFPFTSWIAGRLEMPVDRLSLASFWIIFSIVYLPFQAMIRTLNDELVPGYPAVAERVGGFFSGVLQGLILCAGIFLSVLPQLPATLPNLDFTRFLFPFDEVLTKAYRMTEEKVSAPNPLSRSLVPVAAPRKAGEPMKVSWK